jgi:hypothetical protein
MRYIPLLLSLVAGGVLIQPAFAQINPFRNSQGEPLNTEDLKALENSSYRLLDRSVLEPGATDSWHVQHSSGTVSAGNAVTRKGLNCRVLNYKVAMTTGPDKDRTSTLTWCKTKDGWKID